MVVELAVLLIQGLQLLFLNLDLLILVGELLLLLLVSNLKSLDLKLLTAVLLLLRIERLDQGRIVRLLLVEVSVEAISTVLLSLLLLSEGLDLLNLLAELILHGLLLLHELLDGVVLVELETRTEFNSLVKLSNLSSQLTDDLAGLLFLLLSGLDQFPGLVNLFLKETDG